MILVTFGVISLCIYPSGIFRKDKCAESHFLLMLKFCKRAEGFSSPERESSEVRHEFPAQSREPPPWSSMGGLHLGLSCNITASEITTSNAPWILTVLLEQMDLGQSCGGSRKSCEINESEQSLWPKSFLYHLHAI